MRTVGSVNKAKRSCLQRAGLQMCDYPTPSAMYNVVMYPSSSKNLNFETEDTVYWFSTAFDPLNNWSAHAIKFEGKHFPTVEHAFHYYKFFETAPEIAEQIRKAPSPWAAMQIERKNTAKRRQDWQEVKVTIMTSLIQAKTAQNEDVATCLLATGGKRIVENSPWDNFWGCGEDGKGRNMMGDILEKVRNELRS
jgi:ribA/ribD-fused uncharacterized protein